MLSRKILNFIRTGELKPLYLGMELDEILEIFGSPHPNKDSVAYKDSLHKRIRTPSYGILYHSLSLSLNYPNNRLNSFALHFFEYGERRFPMPLGLRYFKKFHGMSPEALKQICRSHDIRLYQHPVSNESSLVLFEPASFVLIFFSLGLNSQLHSIGVSNDWGRLPPEDGIRWV